jgi:uncharacterized protein (DUF1499 family)
VRLATCLAFGLALCATASADVPLSPDLSCSLSTNCVTSQGDAAAPLRYEGTAERGLALLRATLASFPEAKIVRAEPLAIEVIFTTRMGFQDQVDFRVSAQGGRIDYRSRSLFGVFDWGKNRARMDDFSDRFKAARS